ncbi:MAG: aminotransferase [Firmicutes bacterium]|nr:aminotransferase [Bacillota bacterium]
MKTYQSMNRQELAEAKSELMKRYQKYKDMDLALNIARGNPSTQQLDMIMPMMDMINSGTDCRDMYGTDARNYGALLGLREAREYFGALLGTTVEETIVVGASSINFMYDCLARAMLKGVLGSEKPWGKYDKIKFICPVPGYDRHFGMCEFFGIEMIQVLTDEEGPDMDTIRKYVESDPTVKGMWCIPKFSNPLGITYSDRVVKELAALKPAANDFRIFWDNSYMVHAIYEDVPLLNILDECKKAGNPDMVYMFGSTSKITMAGSGIGFFGASKANVDFTESQVKYETISWDKMNMLRHVRFLKSQGGVPNVMKKHAEILKPKFDAVFDTLSKELEGKGAGTWTKPKGGYFITFIANDGTATRINELVKACGVTMTGPGATHPYHNDPDDRYLRIAPSFPPVEELIPAMEVFAVCAQIATIEQLESRI